MAQPNAAALRRLLREAWQTEEVGTWYVALEEIALLTAVRPALERFGMLYASLKKVTPQWATRLLNYLQPR